MACSSRGSNYDNSKNPDVAARSRQPRRSAGAGTDRAGQYVLLVQAQEPCETLPTGQVPTIPTTDPPKAAASPDADADLRAGIAGPVQRERHRTTPATGNQAEFISAGELDASFPPFLKDIADNEVKATKTVVFESTPTSAAQPRSMHTIDGKKFDGNVGAGDAAQHGRGMEDREHDRQRGVKTASRHDDPPGVVDHPFHIHINPFQIVEFFDPNERAASTAPRPTNTSSGAGRSTGSACSTSERPETWKTLP